MAVLVVAPCQGRDAFREWWLRVRSWRAAPRWYLLALLGPIVLHVMIVLVNGGLGAPLPTSRPAGGLVAGDRHLRGPAGPHRDRRGGRLDRLHGARPAPPTRPADRVGDRLLGPDRVAHPGDDQWRAAPVARDRGQRRVHDGADGTAGRPWWQLVPGRGLARDAQLRGLLVPLHDGQRRRPQSAERAHGRRVRVRRGVRLRRRPTAHTHPSPASTDAPTQEVHDVDRHAPAHL